MNNELLLLNCYGKSDPLVAER